MTDDSINIDRRKFLAGVAGIGAVGVAGCLSEAEENSEEVGMPELTFDPDQLDEPLRYIVKSLHYQNQQLK